MQKQEGCATDCVEISECDFDFRSYVQLQLQLQNENELQYVFENERIVNRNFII